jgi:hypothetical protein
MTGWSRQPHHMDGILAAVADHRGYRPAVVQLMRKNATVYDSLREHVVRGWLPDGSFTLLTATSDPATT